MMKSRYQVLHVLPVVMLGCSLLPAPAQAQFTQQAKLVGTGVVGGGAYQGSSASISGDGNTAIVGGPIDNKEAGAAWVYTRSGGEWSQQAKLVATDAVGSAFQGSSVSLCGDGNTAIVGGIEDNNGVGAAWVFVRSGGAWTQQAKLVGTGAEFGTIQGISVSLSGDGDTAIVGGDGAAWVYTRSGGIWSQQAKLVGGNPAAFYASLSGDGNTAIIGEPSDNGNIGDAWVYTRSDGVWSQQAKLVGTGVIGPYAFQGTSVSLSADGNTAIVGGNGDNDYVGAAWVFTRSGGAWTQQTKLVGTDAIDQSYQGISVSLSSDGDTAIVGGPFDNVSIGSQVGAAWVFTRSGGIWSQQSKLVGTGAITPANQGRSVSLSGDGSTAIVGGPFDNVSIGAAWVFAQPVFAGTPGKANCHGKSVSALAQQYGGLNGAAAALGYADVSALQDTIETFCSQG
jgi:hypothetical protein